MKRHAKTIGFVGGAVVAAAVLLSLATPGCFRQNQDNSPISIRNAPDGPVLNVSCNTDGSVAYVTDGRNVYRYARNVPGSGAAWECILSQGQRLELAARHDPREQPPAEEAQKAEEQKTEEGEPSKKDETATRP